MNRYVTLVAVAISTTGTAAAAATREFATGTARFHRLGFVDGQVTAIVILAMERIDGALAFFGAAHGDEAKTAGTAGFTVHDQVGFGDSAVLSKKLVQVLFVGLEGKISYVQFHVVFLYVEVATSQRLMKSVQAHA